jgi:hypothetical protein
MPLRLPRSGEAAGGWPSRRPDLLSASESSGAVAIQPEDSYAPLGRLMMPLRSECLLGLLDLAAHDHKVRSINTRPEQAPSATANAVREQGDMVAAREIDLSTAKRRRAGGKHDGAALRSRT